MLNIKRLWFICRDFKTHNRLESYPAGWQRVIVSRKTGTEVLIINDMVNKITFVCVRGSENNFIDWFHNILIFPVRKDIATFHYSFYRKAMSVYEKLKQALWDNNSLNNNKICFTGHSQGGAVVAILNYLFLYDGIKLSSSVTTFGCPGFTKKNNLCKNTFNYINGNDLIPQVPPGYTRFGTDRYIAHKNKWFSWKAHWEVSYDKALVKFFKGG